MITISKVEGGKLGLKTFLFPGGEVGVKLDPYNYRYLEASGPHQIVARIQSSNDLMELVMVTDALRRLDKRPIEVALPYIPYGRQDRVCVAGEAFSLKAFARIINSLKFSKVITFDPHSDVTNAVFDNLKVINQIQIFSQFDLLNRMMHDGLRFVSPDAGSNKKVGALAGYFGHFDFIRADKKRNLDTGAIVSTEVYGDVKGERVMITDDICDGGRTFIELSKVLKERGAEEIYLYVTHGIFSKGTKVLHDAGITAIFTTDSFSATWPGNAGHRPEILELDNAFKL